MLTLYLILTSPDNVQSIMVIFNFCKWENSNFAFDFSKWRNYSGFIFIQLYFAPLKPTKAIQSFGSVLHSVYT